MVTGQEIAIVIGALYAIATAIGNLFPTTVVGKFCLRIALIIHDFEPKAQ